MLRFENRKARKTYTGPKKFGRYPILLGEELRPSLQDIFSLFCNNSPLYQRRKGTAYKGLTGRPNPTPIVKRKGKADGSSPTSRGELCEGGEEREKIMHTPRRSW